MSCIHAWVNPDFLIDSFSYRIDHHSRDSGIAIAPSDTSAIPSTTIDTTPSITTSTTTIT
jgi:hypothetical protein